MADIKIAQLLQAGVHFGHKTRRWNSKMFPYIYVEQNGIHIIDLVQTSRKLKEACDFVYQSALNGKTFLFVGTKPQAAEAVKAEAERAQSFYVNHRWYGGLLTNWQTVTLRIQTLLRLEKEENDGYPIFNKKEAATLKKKYRKLEKQLGGIKKLERIPDVIILIDQNYELTAVREAIKLKIPIVSIVDTNCNPDIIDFPIPGNDDAISSIKMILSLLTDSICEGQRALNKG